MEAPLIRSLQILENQTVFPEKFIELPGFFCKVTGKYRKSDPHSLATPASKSD